MDMDLWKKAVRRLACERMFVACVVPLMFWPVHILVGYVVVGLATRNNLGMWGLLVAIALSALYLRMWAYFIWRGSMDFGGESPGMFPRRNEVSANNPQVLRIVLWYLRKTILSPQKCFVEDVQKNVEKLESELATYLGERSELTKRLNDSGRDAQLQTIDQSALLRVNVLLTMIEERLAVLRSQIDQANQIVKPTSEQAKLIEQHLNRLTRDQRIAHSLKKLGVVDKAITVNDQFLPSLGQSAERSRVGLAELIRESKSIQAAWSEVRLDSALEPEDELRLNA